jgi:murein DD-endopeptidase MepM/ murein hydrolase activator NlpD
VAGADIELPAQAVHVIEARVPRHATLSGLLRAHEIPEELAERAVEAARQAFDLRRLRADQPYRLVRTETGLLREFVYKIDADRFLRLAGLAEDEGTPPAFDVQVVPYEKQHARLALRGEIDREHSSLVSAVAARGETVMLAMDLADVFGGEIDFNNDLQPGDRFEVLFEKVLSEGEFAGYGPILAAEFRNGDRTLTAFRFQAPDGTFGYYDVQGRSLKRFFLRSPLKFEPRISSGFSYRRLHPVLGQWRAHPAIDYRAPAGAPVIAVASGVVVRAGWTGGGGNTVTLRHSNGYETSYLHLSAMSVRAGQRVGQGQVIGRVGATGLATGPHLDYRMKKNGQWVNPLVEHRKLPPGDPVPAAQMAAFEVLRSQALSQFIAEAAVTAAPESRLATAQ